MTYSLLTELRWRSEQAQQRCAPTASPGLCSTSALGYTFEQPRHRKCCTWCRTDASKRAVARHHAGVALHRALLRQVGAATSVGDHSVLQQPMTSQEHLQWASRQSKACLGIKGLL